MALAHILGFPRIGPQRELKKAVDSYWRGDIEKSQLLEQGQIIRRKNWQLQQAHGLDFVSVGADPWYDHVLEMSALLGAVPPRFGHQEGAKIDLDTVFRMARGRAPTGQDTAACEMTKWFDTNYHYIVPELYNNQTFYLGSEKLFDEVRAAKSLDLVVKPVILGPLSYLWLGRIKDGLKDGLCNKLDLLSNLIPVYIQILTVLKKLDIDWVQIDEPILCLDLSSEWRESFEAVYHVLASAKLKILLATYFGSIIDNLTVAAELPVEGLHIDLIRGSSQLSSVIDRLSAYKILSCGIIDGRNIWRNDLNKSLNVLEFAKERLENRLWVAPSCSLLHVPVDLDQETELAPEIKNWFAFAKQKIQEVVLLTRALNNGKASIEEEFTNSDKSVLSRRSSSLIHKQEVKQRMQALSNTMASRSSVYAERAKLQRIDLHLPLFPTTTIGSFPQTVEIRSIRRQYKSGKVTELKYKEFMQQEIKKVIEFQESIGLDVLVHGEPERSDMVEYFGELLDGFVFTSHAWVQSYGSRCVKPPIIYGDVVRSKPMTVDWTTYAKNLTKLPLKGMLTGPITILCWSFVRDDQPREDTAMQIALVLRDEMVDLENAGINIIQIDEPAFREGLPLRKNMQAKYLNWAVKAFRIATSGVKDKTQIHTHMCYSEFNELIRFIADMDADVITIESSRSNMELLNAFKDFSYPNEIGPGIYDVHSPNIPSAEAIVNLLEKAVSKIPPEKIWVNPDCGLKTRDWKEAEAALKNMVLAAKRLREETNAKIA